MTTPNSLYFGDNLDILRQHIADESVDLIYLDPPFNSNATYNVLFRERSGEESAAQITAFDDTWRWGMESEFAYQEVITQQGGKVGELLAAMRAFLGQNDMMAYLTMMAQRLIELHRVLKPIGSIYLHCDPTASHYLKLLMDAVFGAVNYRSEIIWQRTTAHSDSTRYGANTDTILFYTKSDTWTWNPQYQPYDEKYKARFRSKDPDGRLWADYDITAKGLSGGGYEYEYKGVRSLWRVPLETMQRLDAEGRLHFTSRGGIRRKRYLDEMPGRPVQRLWDDIDAINSQARERLGYPTQKPEALLERIISASSNEGDVVLDPFCGCGTAVAAAESLNRHWIGIDVTHLAITLIRHRLHDSFGEDLREYEVIGEPKDLQSAESLALHDRYQFEWWALGLVDARPARDRKKGADAGIDGFINFFDDTSGKPKRIVVQVKSGNVQRNQIATLISDMEREKAALALFVTLKAPTEPMRQEAYGAGFYTPEAFPDHQFPKVQILTIEELLAGRRPEYPRYAPAATFQRAPRRRSQGKQGRLA